MSSSLIQRLAVITAVWLLLASAPVWASAAEAENVGSGCPGDNNNNNSDTCTVAIDWNPTLSCDEPFSSGLDLMDCILDSGPPECGSNPNTPTSTAGGSSNNNQALILQANPPEPSYDVCIVTHETGVYQVTPMEAPRVGFNIVRIEDGVESEIDRLHMTENFPGLTWIEIHVEQPYLSAIIGEIEGAPKTGLIELTLNDRPVPVVQTVFYDSPEEVTLALVAAIRAAHFDAVYQRPFIVVYKDLDDGSGLTRIRFKSTDPGIVKSEIALEHWERSDPDPELPQPPPR